MSIASRPSRCPRASNVVIYTIGIFDSSDRDANAGVLKELATITGGARSCLIRPAV